MLLHSLTSAITHQELNDCSGWVWPAVVENRKHWHNSDLSTYAWGMYSSTLAGIEVLHSWATSIYQSDQDDFHGNGQSAAARIVVCDISMPCADCPLQQHDTKSLHDPHRRCPVPMLCCKDGYNYFPGTAWLTMVRDSSYEGVKAAY